MKTSKEMNSKRGWQKDHVSKLRTDCVIVHKMQQNTYFAPKKYIIDELVLQHARAFFMCLFLDTQPFCYLDILYENCIESCHRGESIQ
jgi:hypothetical protein